LGIRIPDPDPGARKLRNFRKKCTFRILKKNFTTTVKRYKIAPLFEKKLDEKHQYFFI
jgi:hypothetical protein